MAGLSSNFALQCAIGGHAAFGPTEPQQSVDYRGRPERYPFVHHGLASEAALHGRRPYRSRPLPAFPASSHGLANW